MVSIFVICDVIKAQKLPTKERRKPFKVRRKIIGRRLKANQSHLLQVNVKVEFLMSWMAEASLQILGLPGDPYTMSNVEETEELRHGCLLFGLEI